MKEGGLMHVSGQVKEIGCMSGTIKIVGMSSSDNERRRKDMRC